MTEGNEFHPPKIYAIWVDARPESPMAGLSGFLSENSRRLFFTERGDAELKIRDMEALRLNRHPAAEYRCVEYPGGYDAERSIQAELLKTISLQADPEIMRYEVTDRIYGNTGGGCMVGTLAVRLPDLDKTIWINCNDEGVTITSADYVWNEDDSGSWERYEDVVMFGMTIRNPCGPCSRQSTRPLPIPFGGRQSTPPGRSASRQNGCRKHTGEELTRRT